MDDYKNISFYPHHGPSKYSYTSAFGDANNREKTAAQAKTNTAYSGIVAQPGNKFKILFNLKMLINGARKAEMGFLSSTGIDLSNGTTAKELFKNFNYILGSKEVFERNIKLILQMSKDKTTKIEDPSKFFYSYLQKAIKEVGVAENFNIKKSTKEQLANFVDKIVGIALEDTYSHYKEFIDDKGYQKTFTGGTSQKDVQYINAYTEIIDVIKKLQGTGIFYKYSNLFNIDKLLQESSNKKGEIIKRPHLSKRSFDNGGTVLEFIEATVGKSLQTMHLTNSSAAGTLYIEAEQTGGSEYNLQKADVTFGYATEQIDFEPMKQSFANRDKDGGVRLQNIRALENYLQTVTSSMKNIVFVSDKNYAIKAGWKGVKAQDAMTLVNARDMLEQFGVEGVDALIDYLSNCGDDMIQGEANPRVETALAAQVGYYLFDHLEITGNTTGTNIVNVINISGLYVPLSVYLEGVYKSLEANLDKPSTDFVRVSISYGGDEPSSSWTVATWQDFRASRERETTIKYYILRDINSFITNLMS